MESKTLSLSDQRLQGRVEGVALESEMVEVQRGLKIWEWSDILRLGWK